MSRMAAILSRVFKYEQIDGNGRCPTYLHRWTLFQPRRPRRLWRGFGIYLHNFVGDDWSLDLHDHPKRFISIGLKGAYRELTPSPDYMGAAASRIFPCGCSHLKVAAGLCSHYSHRERVYRAPWVRTFPAEHIHRIELLDDRAPVWTLVIVLWHVREWGFWHRGNWRHWRGYVQPGNPIADDRRACR